MAVKNEITGKIVMPGLDVADDDPSKVETVLLSYDLNKDRSATGYGQPVTLAAACVMINNYHTALADSLKEAINNKDNVSQEAILKEGLAVIFGKETLLRLLSQPNCEAIRFYSCINDVGRVSLVLSGIDKDEKDIIALRNGAENLLDIVAKRNASVQRGEILSLNTEVELSEKGGPDDDGDGGKYSFQDYIEGGIKSKGLTASLFKLFKDNFGVNF
jgi:hypothetical protein